MAPRAGELIRSVALASLIGTTIEWYDIFLNGTAAALVFNRLYFPSRRHAQRASSMTSVPG